MTGNTERLLNILEKTGDSESIRDAEEQLSRIVGEGSPQQAVKAIRLLYRIDSETLHDHGERIQQLLEEDPAKILFKVLADLVGKEGLDIPEDRVLRILPQLDPATLKAAMHLLHTIDTVYPKEDVAGMTTLLDIAPEETEPETLRAVILILAGKTDEAEESSTVNHFLAAALSEDTVRALPATALERIIEAYPVTAETVPAATLMNHPDLFSLHEVLKEVKKGQYLSGNVQDGAVTALIEQLDAWHGHAVLATRILEDIGKHRPDVLRTHIGELAGHIPDAAAGSDVFEMVLHLMQEAEDTASVHQQVLERIGSDEGILTAVMTRVIRTILTDNEYRVTAASFLVHTINASNGWKSHYSSEQVPVSEDGTPDPGPLAPPLTRAMQDVDKPTTQLKAVLQSGEQDVRIIGLLLLHEYLNGHPEDAEAFADNALYRILDEGNTELKRYAADILVSIAENVDNRDLLGDIFTSTLHDDDRIVRIHALRGIAACNAMTAIDDVKALKDDEDRKVRMFANRTLRALQDGAAADTDQDASGETIHLESDGDIVIGGKEVDNSQDRSVTIKDSVVNRSDIDTDDA